MISLVLALTSVARADPPGTTVVFGAPAAELRVEAPIERAPEPPPREEVASEERASVPDERSPATEPSSPPSSAVAPACPRAITIVRRFGARTERVRMPLLDCDGQPREEARRAISVLARSRALEAPPSEEELAAWRARDEDPELLAEGVRLLHPGLLERLQHIGEQFDPHPIEIVSGYRPESPSRSRHHHARALDIVVRGAPREALRDLAVTFPQTGVGWYPNSVFVHVDVREESAYWVDLSGPGERPRYVRGAEPPTPGGAAASAEPSEAASAIDEALDTVRRDLRVTAPSASASSEEADAGGDEEEPLGDEELARLRRETEAALRGIVVPAL